MSGTKYLLISSFMCFNAILWWLPTFLAFGSNSQNAAVLRECYICGIAVAIFASLPFSIYSIRTILQIVRMTDEEAGEFAAYTAGE